MAKKFRPVMPEDLYLLKQLSGCELSPDGKLLATTIAEVNKSENKTYSHLYIKPTRRGALRQFTRGRYMDSHPRFSPDGKLIAFHSNRSEKMQVHLLPVDGGESWQLTHLEGIVYDFAWAPDGKSLCVVVVPQDAEAKAREKQKKLGKKGVEQPIVRHITNYHYKADGMGYLPQSKSELHIVDIKTGKARVLFKDDFHNGQPVFTPDGKWIVFCSNKHPDYEREWHRWDLWKIRIAGKGGLKKIETFDGPSWDHAISPSGKHIAFLGWPDPDKEWAESNLMLHVVPINGGTPRCLSADLDRSLANLSLNDTWGLSDAGPPRWSADGKWIYSVVTTDGNTELYRFDVEHSGGFPVIAEPGVVLSFAIDHQCDKLYCAFSDYETPSDLFSCNFAGDRLRRLTRVNPWLRQRDLGQIEELWVKGREGHRIHGWIMTPPDANLRKKHPGVLYIHGGPHVAYARAIFHELNYLAGQGYVVFFCNPRGSHGYGVAYTSAIKQEWGEKDYDDIMKFTDAVLRKYPFIDRQRLGVTGGSYGGYMTNWIIGHTQRFKAAVTQRSVSNLLSFVGTSDAGYLLQREFQAVDKTPWEEAERYLKMSPMTYMAKAKTPTLVIHSEGDLRAPIEQGEQVYIQLKLQGVETEMVRFPQESHGLSRGGRTDRRIERLKRIRNWFDRYLRDN